MRVLPTSEVRANFKAVVDAVIEDCEPVAVSRHGGKAVAMISLDDWNAISETLHLMSTPANAQWLRESIAELDSGSGEEHELINL